jgi:hypothetical protein
MAAILTEYIEHCDLDELGAMFDTTFGTCSVLDLENGSHTFIVKPGRFYGGIIEDESGRFKIIKRR